MKKKKTAIKGKKKTSKPLTPLSTTGRKEAFNRMAHKIRAIDLETSDPLTNLRDAIADVLESEG